MARPWKTTVVVGGERIALAIDIDWEAVARQLARQAVANKSGKATQLHGAIKAKRIPEGR